MTSFFMSRGRSAQRRARTALVLLFAIGLVLPARGQDPLRPAPNGLETHPAHFHALVGATVHHPDGTATEKATIVLSGDRIVSVIENGVAPVGARVHDLKGLHVWPGLIEPCLPVAAPKKAAERPGAHWNGAVTPDRSVLDGDGAGNDVAGRLRKLGYTAAAIAPEDGMFRGSAAVVSLADREDDEAARVHARSGYQMVDFVRGSGYPRALMGNIALMRQTLMDGDWTRKHGGEAPSVLRHLPEAGHADGRPLWLFDSDDELDLLRLVKILDENGLHGAAILGSGSEYQRIGAVVEALKGGGHPLVLPLAFPEAPSLKTASDVDSVELSTLLAWESAPTNPDRLNDAGVPFVLTTAGRRGPDAKFHEHAQKAIEEGMKPQHMLAKSTIEVARMLGLEGRLGDVREGHLAHLVVTDGPLFEKGTKILDVWIDGEREIITERKPEPLTGVWDLTFLGDAREPLRIEVDPAGKLVAVRGDNKASAKNLDWDGSQLTFGLDGAKLGDKDQLLFSGLLRAGGTPTLDGRALTPDGQSLPFQLSKTPIEDAEEVTDEIAEEESDDPQGGLPGLPFGPYALGSYPDVETLVIRGATLWTSADAGIIEDGSLVASGGRILFVGPTAKLDAFLAANPLPEGARTLDGAGLHLTPGLIDCHSHTGISRGINEGTQSVTAEVRIQDVTDPDDISWYRQLAGGVTAANCLHGSANPIGGQSQTVKIRWGVAHPDDMHFEGAKKGIKFALGENVKRSNGTRPQTRYPSTRMGVATLIEERFIAAERYAEARRHGGDAVRRDLELEALVEILEGERWIHCHSYRQDEILMLCNVAKRFGFKIGTFQHILEGYKVAPEIAEVAHGASAFSDWWQYKMEVQDAIPWAGAIMHEQGVNVSFNSDSDELARRMNLEAAKAVRYGGLDPATALHFVTINPAIQLGVDHRVGSLEVGKDADLALWTTNPLSTRARCAATWVDGRPLFSLERDAAHRENIRSERRRLIEAAMSSGGKGGSSSRGSRSSGEARAKGSLIEQVAADMLREHFLELIRLGFDPRYSRCGDCGTLGR